MIADCAGDRKLVDRANHWLRRRRYHGDGDVTMTVKTCETMTWMSRDVSQLADSESMVTSKSVIDGANTYYLRGLRYSYSSLQVQELIRR